MVQTSHAPTPAARVAQGRGNTHIAGCVLTPQGWVRGHVVLSADGTRIQAIEGLAVDAPAPHEVLVLPGFVDLHVHGGGGADVMDGGGAVDTVARTHARYGTTSLLATTMTAPHDDLVRALADVGRAMREPRADAARILGVHLEGPFISPDKLGAQPPPTRLGTQQEVAALCVLAPIRLLTLAPEMPGHLDFIASLRRMGIVAQLGHSNASYEEALAALNAGASGFTHLFNAMSPLQHRAPGMVGAALAHAHYAELIPDLLHVHPGAIRAARRAIPKLFGVTDSTAGTGMPDGSYRLGSHTVHKCQGGVRLADGTLAGSVLTMDQALRNLVQVGVPLREAVQHLSTYPADYLGEPERGRLEVGAHADVLRMTAQLALLEVFIGGCALHPADAAPSLPSPPAPP